MKRGLVLIALTAAVLCSCKSGAVNKEYIEDLKGRGADKAAISELIKYERANAYAPTGGYVDVTGRTVEDVAKERKMTLSEYLSEYSLPSDMPALVSETEANYTIPCRRMAEMFGMSFDTLIQTFELPDTITEDTPWGAAIGETTVGIYAGGTDIEEFREMYKLPDTVTADTKWKEVRETVDARKKEQREISGQ